MRSLDPKKKDEVIDKLFAVLTEDKSLSAADMEDIVSRFTDLVKAAAYCLVAGAKADEFVERGWKVMQAHRLDREPAKG